MTNSNHTSSLLTKDASTAIKGFLMLLIVFGHIRWLNIDFTTGERTFFWNWLYTFHVFIYFILPFIYGYKRGSNDAVYEKPRSINKYNIFEDIKKNIVKLGVPYCWFFLISIIIFVLFGEGEFHAGGAFRAFIYGNQPLLKQFVGFHFIWFLPAMFSLLVLKSIYYNSNGLVKKGIVIISIFLWLLSFIGVSRTIIGMYVPFALSQAFYFVIWCIVSRCICEKHFKPLMPFVILLILFFSYLLYTHKNPLINLLLSLVMPILVFLILFTFNHFLAKSHFLKTIGGYSLQIYLVHVYIVNALEKILAHYFAPSWVMGVFVFILTLVISIGISVLIIKIPFVNKLMFPTLTKAKKE